MQQCCFQIESEDNNWLHSDRHYKTIIFVESMAFASNNLTGFHLQLKNSVESTMYEIKSTPEPSTEFFMNRFSK